MFKIQPDAYDGLCRTCRYSQIVTCKDRATVTRCYAGVQLHPMLIVKPVARCTDYDDRRLPSMAEMEAISWHVKTDSSGLVIGFKPPAKDD